MKSLILLLALTLHSQTGPSISIYSGSGGFGLTGTRYFPIGGGGNPPNSVESIVQTTISADTSLSKFGVRVSNAQGSGNIATFTVRKNASDTALSCTVTNPAVTCQDVTHSVPVSAGDLIDIKATFNATVASGSSSIFTFSTQIGAAGVAPGQITLILSGTCPAGFSEVAALDGKTVIGTVSAHGNVGSTGGSDTITPAGTVAAIAPTPGPSVKTANGAAQTIPALLHLHPAPAFTGISFDNRSAFVRVIFCLKD